MLAQHRTTHQVFPSTAVVLVHHLFKDSTVLEGLEKPKIAFFPPTLPSNSSLQLFRQPTRARLTVQSLFSQPMTNLAVARNRSDAILILNRPNQHKGAKFLKNVLNQ